MSVFDEFNATKPSDGEEIQGQFWCKAPACFDVVEEATYYPSVKRVEWTCEEGHQNTEEEFEIG